MADTERRISTLLGSQINLTLKSTRAWKLWSFLWMPARLAGPHWFRWYAQDHRQTSTTACATKLLRPCRCEPLQCLGLKACAARLPWIWQPSGVFARRCWSGGQTQASSASVVTSMQTILTFAVLLQSQARRWPSPTWTCRRWTPHELCYQFSPPADVRG